MFAFIFFLLQGIYLPGSDQHLPEPGIDEIDWVLRIAFFGPMVIAVVGYLYFRFYKNNWQQGVFPKKLPYTPTNLLEAYICLSAYFMQRDRSGTKEKLGFITVYFRRKFPEEYYDFYDFLGDRYSFPIAPRSVAQWMVAQEAGPGACRDMLIFLIRLTGIDGLIIDREYVLLKQMAHTLGFEENHFQELLEKYGPKRPETPPPMQHNTARTVELHCRTLGIATGASKTLIKQAYRALVKRHHPDKFQQASKEIQEQNQSRFIAIQEAYDYLYNR